MACWSMLLVRMSVCLELREDLLWLLAGVPFLMRSGVVDGKKNLPDLNVSLGALDAEMAALLLFFLAVSPRLDETFLIAGLLDLLKW